MEQIQETDDFYSAKKHSNKKTLRKRGKASEIGKTCSLPGMYLMSHDVGSLPDSSAKISLSKSRDSKDLDEHWLKERLSCKHIQPSEEYHYNKPSLDKSVNKCVSDACLSSNFNSFDMFPPLGTHLQLYKSGKAPAVANRHLDQKETVKISFDVGHGECIRTNLPQSKAKNNFAVSQVKCKSEWKEPSFWNVKGEKTFSPQAGDKRETFDSLPECSKPSLPAQSNMGLHKSVKAWNVTVPGGELCQIITQKTNVIQGIRKSTRSCEHNTRTMVFHRKPLLDYLLGPEVSHRIKNSGQNLHLSSAKKANANTCFGRGLEKLDNKQPSSSVLDPIIGKKDSSGSSECTDPTGSPNKTSASSSKCTIISYLEAFLESHEPNSLQPSCNLPDPKCLASSETVSTDDLLTNQDAACVEKSCMSEEKLVAEFNKVCEEMLDHYIVISNLPCGISRGDVFHHIGKVGIVSYFIMNGNRAHIIFLKAEDAEMAFGLRHELCGKQLVMYRPKRPSCTLYLSGLTNNTPNEEVIQVVSEFGVIISFYRPLHKLSSSPAAYCFIKVDKKVAEDILKHSSFLVNKVKIFVEVSSQSELKVSTKMSSTQQSGSVPSHLPGNSEEFKVVFADVPQMVSYNLIKEHFQEFGRLQKVFLRNRKGFVIFTSQDSMEQALSARHTILGTEVKLQRA